MFRIGYGYDTHRLEEGYNLWLGGVNIPSDLGAVGHSDADVLIHAICDAILGAANLRDIGYHFPDTDPSWKGARSDQFLKHSMKLIRDLDFELSNVDATIITEKPKINPHVEDIQSSLSAIMNVETEQISIKATTNEKVGFIGRREAIVVQCVALIEK